MVSRQPAVEAEPEPEPVPEPEPRRSTRLSRTPRSSRVERSRTRCWRRGARETEVEVIVKPSLRDRLPHDRESLMRVLPLIVIGVVVLGLLIVALVLVFV